MTLRYEGDTPAERRAASRRRCTARTRTRSGCSTGCCSRAARPRTHGVPDVPGLRARRMGRVRIGYALGIRTSSCGACRRSCRPRSSSRPGSRSATTRTATASGPDHVPGARPVGAAVGIGARVRPGGRDEGPKYTRTRPRRPSTARARSSTTSTERRAPSRRSGEVFLVEGYTDVIAMARAGVATRSRRAAPRSARASPATAVRTTDGAGVRPQTRPARAPPSARTRSSRPSRSNRSS